MAADSNQVRSDPIADLAATLVLLDSQATRSGAKLRRNEENRINMLIVHALAALVVAPLFIASKNLFTGPSWEYIRLVPGFPWTFGLLFAFGGLILLPATIARLRELEILGLAMLSAWYTILGIGFAIPAVAWSWDALPALWAGRPLPPNQPGLYAWGVYAHLSVIMRVHMLTLWRMTREERRRSDRRCCTLTHFTGRFKSRRHAGGDA